MSKTNTLNCQTNFFKLDCFINSDFAMTLMLSEIPIYTEAHLMQSNIHILHMVFYIVV